MKKILFTALIAATSLTATAQDENKYLIMRTYTDATSIELATVQKISFNMESSTVIVTTTQGNVSFPQSEMKKMYFNPDEVTTGVDALPTASEDLQVQQGNICAKGNGLLRIYNAAGLLQQLVYVEGPTRISLSTLPKGVYIINLDNQTIKIKK